jgi:hypothetical protein
MVQAKKYKRYKDMTAKELDLRLRKRKVLDAVRVALVEKVKAQRKLINKQKRVVNHIRNKWQEILDPLLAEHEAIRVRVTQLRTSTHSHHEQYLHLYSTYLDVLKTMREFLRLKQRTSNVTPIEAMVGKTNSGAKRTAVNTALLPLGASWIDWIDEVVERGGLPHNIIHTLTTQHHALPYTRRPPEPLFRRDEHQKRRSREQHNKVLEQWGNELHHAMHRKGTLPADHPEQAGLDKTIQLIRLAMDRLHDMPFTRRAPTRWTSLIKSTDYDTLFGKDCGLSGAALPPSVLDEYEYLD